MNKNGFVFGKFYPPHSGHMALIDFAASQCESLTVLICCSDKELIDPGIRLSWLEDNHFQHDNIQIKVFEYKEDLLPNTSISSMDVSKVWSDAFMERLPDSDVVFTSEKYGDYVANYMGIDHIAYQYDRSDHPISSSDIRSDILSHWPYLLSGAKQYFQQRIFILGTESTGKSTLSEKLADYYSGSLVREVAREVISDSNVFAIEDLHEVASAHASNIENSATALLPVLVVDTDIYITQSYAKNFFSDYIEVNDWVYQQNKADLRIYLDVDTPYIQDGTRLEKSERDQLDTCHQETLKDFGIDVVKLTGAYEKRGAESIKHIRKLFEFEW